jgi:hypothetical protein
MMGSELETDAQAPERRSDMKPFVGLTLSLALAASAITAAAQQNPATPGAGQNPAAPGIGHSAKTADTTGEALTIDCPSAAAKDAPSAMPGPAGTPSGAGAGSGIAARPSQGPAQKVEGVVSQIESTRTERGIMVGDVKLWVEPTTAILVGCQKAQTDDLKKGTRIKAIYEVKDGRNVAKVIEADKQ